MDEFTTFNKELSAKLDAQGFTDDEKMIGALTAETQAALKLCNPLAAMALSNTFAKAMAVLSARTNTDPHRICAAAEIIYDAARAIAKEKVAAFEAGKGKRTVMTAELDDSPAIDPKDIN